MSLPALSDAEVGFLETMMDEIELRLALAIMGRAIRETLSHKPRLLRRLEERALTLSRRTDSLAVTKDICGALKI